ncbi:MAG: glycosyltransferase family 2 protein [Candidatus Promineifilaceae bacterium]|jgi:glycosyltransferase involved in cell wall biosynthesis
MNEKPLISIVTPSLNQDRFLRETILSVLGQENADLEYVIIDGGSGDNSVSIIKDFEQDSRLIYWCSEPDSGHYDALNKGFSHTSGEIMAWLNSDDLYLPGTLSIISDLFQAFPEIKWLTTTQHVHFNARGQMTLCRYVGGYNGQAFWRGSNLTGQEWFGRALIQQEATFWRRSLWDRAGGRLDDAYSLAGDFELWTRFVQYAPLYAADVPLAGIRKHEAQQTAVSRKAYFDEATKAFRAAGGRPYGRLQSTWRRALWILGGHRSYQKLPAAVGRLLVKLGILYPVKVCVWQDGRWTIVDDYVV